MTWQYIYVSMFAIGYICSDCGVHKCVDTLKLQINIMLLFMFHYITMRDIYHNVCIPVLLVTLLITLSSYEAYILT